MYDPEFDELLSKKLPDSPPITQTRTKDKPSRTRTQAFILWWPVSRRAQAIFAEALRQSLVEGLAVDQAVRLAARVTPGHRFRQALLQMATYLRSGYTLEAALVKTGVGVQPSLLIALRTGEEHDCLDEALSAFARRTGRLTAKTYHRRIGRSPEAIQFAAALARLLRGHRLTVREIQAAGSLAAGGNRKFGRIVEEVVHRMEDGDSLVDTLGRYPGHFDALYRGFLELTTSREDTKTCLERLGRECL